MRSHLRGSYLIPLSSSRDSGNWLRGCWELPKAGQASVGPTDLAWPWTRERTALPWGLPPGYHPGITGTVGHLLPPVGVGQWIPVCRSHNPNLLSLHRACSPKHLHPRFGRWRGYFSQLGYWPLQTRLQAGVQPGVFTCSFGVKITEIPSPLRLGQTLEMIQNSVSGTG